MSFQENFDIIIIIVIVIVHLLTVDWKSFHIICIKKKLIKINQKRGKIIFV